MHLQARPVVISDDARSIACAQCDARTVGVCGFFDESLHLRLRALAEPLTLSAEQPLVHEGELATSFFNVTRGTLRIYKLMADGRQQITGFATVGYFLGLAATRVYAFSASAIEPAGICRFPRAKLLDLIENFPHLERRLLEAACNDLAADQQRMLLLGRYTARERVACFLMHRLTEAAPCGNADRVRLAMHRTDIADYLGLTTETVSRMFSRLRAEKLIASPAPDVVVVLDRAGLAAAAELAE